MQTIQEGFDEVLGVSFASEPPEAQRDQLQAFFFAGIRWLATELGDDVRTGNVRTLHRVESELAQFIAGYHERHGVTEQ